MRDFRQFADGLKQFFIQRPFMFILSLCAALAPFFYLLNDKKFTVTEFILELFWVAAFLQVVGIYAARKAPGQLSTATVQKDFAPLSMRIVSYVPGGADPNLMIPIVDYDAGNISKIFLSIQNDTGEKICTDASFAFEQKIWGKWYAIEPLLGNSEPWQPLEIPVGLSERICIPTAGRYQILTPGEYRILKSFPTNQGTITLASEFSVD